MVCLVAARKSGSNFVSSSLAWRQSSARSHILSSSPSGQSEPATYPSHCRPSGILRDTPVPRYPRIFVLSMRRSSFAAFS